MTNRLFRGIDRRRVVGVPLLVSVALLGCAGDDDPLTPTEDQPPRIALSSIRITLAAVGDTHQLTAVVLDGGGREIAAQVTWESSHPQVAAASGTGLITVAGVGTALITASLDSLSSTVSAIVGDPGRIAFTTFHAAQDGEIYVMEADGFDTERLTVDPGFDGHPTWSPDRTKIAWTVGGEAQSEIYVMDADGLNLLNLTRSPLQDEWPAWSPDGTRIAFVTNRDGNSEIYVMDADGLDQRNLTRHPEADLQPEWSPDGTRIAFISGRAQGIHVMDADGSNTVLLSGEQAATFAWSPDGRRIAFGTLSDGSGEIHVMDADGSNVVNLTNHPSDDSDPSWSLDGTKIAFASTRAGNVEIFVMDADGSNPTQLTSDPRDSGMPSWWR